MINSFYCICDIFQRIQLKDKTLRRTLTKTTLDHLARNNMARKVDHFNGVQCVSSTTNDPFPVLRKAKLPNDDREEGEGGGGVKLAWLFGRATVISSRSFIRSAMFDLELEWTEGVRGGERMGGPLPEENVEKQNTPWLVVPHCISDNEQVTNQNELNYQLDVLSTA